MALQANERMHYSLARDASLVVRKDSPTAPRPPKLLDRVREANRLRHGSRSTEKSYVEWIRRSCSGPETVQQPLERRRRRAASTPLQLDPGIGTASGSSRSC